MLANVFVLPLDGLGLDLFKPLNRGARLILADHSVVRTVPHYAIRNVRVTTVILP